MQEITYETIEQKIKTLYDPRYHFYGGRYYSNSAIAKYNYECFNEGYPNQKKYYTNPMDICLDYFSIKNEWDQLWEQIEAYESDKIEELPDEYDTVGDMYESFEDYEKIVTLAAANMEILQDVFEELQQQEAPIETEAKHLFKNVPLVTHHR